MIRGVLFDLDGVVIDSEKLHHRAYEEALRPMGIDGIPFELYAEHWSSLGDWPEFVEHEWQLDAEELRARKIPIFESMLRDAAELRDGAAEAIARVAGRWPISLATNSPRAVAMFVLERFDLARHFTAVVGREDYATPKPAPDAFLEALKRLDVSADEAAVVEDSEKGLRAAVAAGVRCIAVPNAYTAGGDFSLAALRLDGLDALTVASIEGAVG